MRAILRLLPAAALLTPPLPAFAHAMLSAAVPAVGGTVRAAPAQIEITFSEAVEPLFSTIVVTDGTGRQVDRNDLHVSANDPRRLAVSVGTLGPGEYKVTWHATSVDTHKTEGAYSFTVAP